MNSLSRIVTFCLMAIIIVPLLLVLLPLIIVFLILSIFFTPLRFRTVSFFNHGRRPDTPPPPASGDEIDVDCTVLHSEEVGAKRETDEIRVLPGNREQQG